MNPLDRLRSDFPHLDAIPLACVITGGAVRDVHLGRTPLDLDMACDDAEGIAASFARDTRGKRVTLGTRHRTERVVVDGAIYDFSPIQGDSIEVDLARRDFTINAIGLQLDGTLIDPFGGLTDLNQKLVRMIDEQNLIDDPLRILRIVRMAASFGFDIDAETARAASRHHDLLTQIAQERVTYELRMIVRGRFARRAAEELRALELDGFVLGFELTEVDMESWARLSEESDDRDERAATSLALLTLRSDSRRLLDRWLWTREELRAAEAILRILDSLELGYDPVRVAAAEEGRLATRRALSISKATRNRTAVEALEALLSSHPSPFDVVPLLDGHEIARITSVEGEEIGRLKRSLWEAQVLGRVSTRDEAIELLRNERESKTPR